MATLLIFIAVLAVLVLSHEFGHFIVARLSGMKVEEFGFGFPPRLCGIRRLLNGRRQIIWGNRQVLAAEKTSGEQGGTIYSFNWLPLGGFVKIKGEDGKSDSEPDSFASKKFWHKAAVLVAGVAMNVLVGAVLISLGFMIGLPQPLEGIDDVKNISDRRIEILQALPGKPAEAAGLKTGDTIIKIGSLEQPRLSELRAYVDAHRDEAILVTWQRGNEKMSQNIRPIVYPDTGKGGLGVSVVEIGTVRYPFFKALENGIITTGFYLKHITLAFGQLIKSLFTGAALGGTVSGPVGVAVMTGQVARMGLVYLLQFMAILSLNLAVLNILPIPALDGGRLLFIILAKIFRRPQGFRYEHVVHAVGFALLILLVVAVTVKDVSMFKGVLLTWWGRIF